MRCICCNKNIIKPMDVDEEHAIWGKSEEVMWMDGIVANISAGYGSKNDGSMYVIAICDDCILKKSSDGTIAYTGDYMSFDCEDQVEKSIENSKKIWRRDQNLDKLT